ncbi:AI-2E family transporter [Methanococcus maripaludis]|uniref:Putative PurR-regulated permease PerM n=1 Tax=Methanococcus maripaludis TaxID=39152 RepID=A0A7J9PQW3_METMI|nr:AI-2E family transporter [Methanococcus maripaludis]MBA2868554.1 putative PurR-regulated permease PerM [Methanococcus maripaludis]
MDNKEYDIIARGFIIFSFFALSYMLWPFVGIIALAVAVAYMTKPLYDLLNPKFGRSYGAIICLLGIVIPSLLLVVLVAEDVITFLLSLDIESILSSITPLLSSMGYLGVPQSDVSKPVTDIWSVSKPLLNNLATQISGIPSILMRLLFLSFMTFYFLKDGDKIKDSFLLYVPKEKKRNAKIFVYELHKAFKTLFIGNAVTSVIVGIISIIGYWIIGIPNPITLGALSGILNILPIVGGWTIYVPLTIYYLLTGEIVKGVLLGLFGIVFLSLAPDFAIRPRVISKDGDLHPALVLIAFLIGPLVFGIPGLAIGPIIVGSAYAIHKVRRRIELEE